MLLPSQSFPLPPINQIPTHAEAIAQLRALPKGHKRRSQAATVWWWFRRRSRSRSARSQRPYAQARDVKLRLIASGQQDWN